MALEMTVEEITPQRAAEYLKKNTNNYRKLARAKVRTYADDMKAHRWQLNGEPVVFGEDGVLKDGQHRLAAIMVSGVSVEMAVIRGVENDINLFDVGSSRTLANIANANGADISRRVVSAANLIMSNFSANMPKGVILDYVMSHRDRLNRAGRLSESPRGGMSRKASCCLATYIALELMEIPPYEIEVFWRIFNTGNTIGSDGYEASPALVARRMFEQRFVRTGGRESQKEQTEIVLMAMNDFHEKKARQNNYTMTGTTLVDKAVTKLRGK